MKKFDSDFEMLINSELFIANGLITDFWDYYDKKPTIKDITDNWHFKLHCKHISKYDVSRIIENVENYYNNHKYTMIIK